MAAGSTYTPIATNTLGSAAATITFSSISGSYTDLIIAGNGIASSDAGIDFQVNSDTGTNYSFTYIYGDGSSTVSGANATSNVGSGGRIGINGGVALLNFMNYSNTTTYKTIISRGANASVLTIATVALWRNTNAITAITLKRGGGGNFSTGSTFTLYGIAAA
jgi:hypothetical protein